MSQYKITPGVLDAWAEILRGTQGTSLLLANTALKSRCNRDFVLDQFSRRGVGPERLELFGPAPHLEFLGHYDRIDVALDAFPYNGGTTTMEAIWQGVPAMQLVINRFPATVYLSLAVVSWSLLLALPMGIVAAVWPRSFIDRITTVISVTGVSMPTFWLALMLIIVFAVNLNWFKTSGYGGIEFLVLPVLALSVTHIGRIAQVMRSCMLDELSPKSRSEQTRILSHLRRQQAQSGRSKDLAMTGRCGCGPPATSRMNGSPLPSSLLAMLCGGGCGPWRPRPARSWLPATPGLSRTTWTWRICSSTTSTSRPAAASSRVPGTGCASSWRPDLGAIRRPAGTSAARTSTG